MEGLQDIALEAVEVGAGTVPLARQVGVAAPSQSWRFRKAPLGVVARDVDLSITVPDDGHQYLVWMPTAEWADGLTAAEVRRWATTSVTVQSCARGVDYLGGILTDDASRCFPLQVQRAAQPSTSRRIALTTGPCT